LGVVNIRSDKKRRKLVQINNVQVIISETANNQVELTTHSAPFTGCLFITADITDGVVRYTSR